MSKTLRAAIDELQQIEKELVKVTTSDAATIDRRRLVKLRASLLQGMLSLGQTARDDTGFSSDPARLKEFRLRHNEVKNLMSQHQANWIPSTISEDPEGYEKSASKLRQANVDFFAWATKVAS